MSSKISSLWRHPDFMKLWGGETISLFGSQITFLALPLTAVLVLKASPVQMGILGAVEFAPFLLLSLFAGVWADRLRRRPILITADLGRACLLGSIPLIFALGWLSIEYLYVVALFTGILTVFFDVAYQAYLPALVDRSQLVEGNGKLEVSRSVAQIAGPGLAGALVQVVSAPVAVVLDALSFLASALFLGSIHQPEAAKVSPAVRKSMLTEIREGLNVVFGNPLLRSIAGCTSTSNLFSNVMGAVFTLYLVNELKLSPGILGLLYAVGGAGSLLGALMANRIARYLGIGRTIIFTAFLFSALNLLVPLVHDATFMAVGILMLAQFVIGFSSPAYNITQVSLRQAITPYRLQGRMNASMRFLVWGTMPIGSLIGGFLGELVGLRSTLLVGAIGSVFAFLWVLFSPVRGLREQPVPVVEAEEATPVVSV